MAQCAVNVCELSRKDRFCLMATLFVVGQVHRARSGEIDAIFRSAQRSDLCFLMDCTGSMQSYIDEVKEKMFAIVNEIEKSYRQLDLRLAFVGYRDFCDEEERLTTVPFTKSVARFVNNVSKKIAMGGGDIPEDVFGGLDAAMGLNWKADTRVLIHICDAPCHGSRFHPPGMSDGKGHMLDNQGRDLNGLSASNVISRLIAMNITYHFYHVSYSNTQKMINEFNNIGRRLGSMNLVSEIDLKESATTLQSAAVLSVTSSIAGSAQVLSKELACSQGFGVAVQDECEFREEVPDWNDVPQELACATWFEPPTSLQALCQRVELLKKNSSIIVKVAPNPFAEGHMRRAFHAHCVKGEELSLQQRNADGLFIWTLWSLCWILHPTLGCRWMLTNTLANTSFWA